ncbi:hypothetical protein GGS23DRAFT_356708 [Durotheca rogersii]|uniref:uncharacterized protein n=1 Tax=Durotheca rogersii TaxID=419775 RepID=UPI002220C400|nr:uncharacterized protein GGS23DRAFT_356708 [Durotheca rogersii]KAI5865835.1 hypothetical protein GGS23DRAFT_356708 [Durotheca rogersii]
MAYVPPSFPRGRLHAAVCILATAPPRLTSDGPVDFAWDRPEDVVRGILLEGYSSAAHLLRMLLDNLAMPPAEPHRQTPAEAACVRLRPPPPYHHVKAESRHATWPGRPVKSRLPCLISRERLATSPPFAPASNLSAQAGSRSGQVDLVRTGVLRDDHRCRATTVPPRHAHLTRHTARFTDIHVADSRVAAQGPRSPEMRRASS